MTESTTVVLVDDHELVRRGVAELLEADPHIRVVGEAGSIDQGRRRISATRPDVALLDVRLPDGSGIDLVRDLHVAAPEVCCIMLTAYDDDDDAMMAAALADAAGYVLKDIRGSGLIDCVRTVAAGHSALDPVVVSAVRDRLRNQSGDARLSGLNPREREVLALIADGLTNRQIGTRLSLAEKTVKNYVSGLLSKLGLQSRTQAAVLHLDAMHRVGRAAQPPLA